MTDIDFNRLAKNTRRDEHRLVSTANKIYNISTFLVPAMVMLGVVATAKMVDAGADPIVIACVALFSVVITLSMYAVAVMSKLVAKLLAHITEVILAEVQDTDAQATLMAASDMKDLTELVIERMSMKKQASHDAVCPSCGLDIDMDVSHCPRCRATFSEGSPFSPIPKK